MTARQKFCAVVLAGALLLGGLAVFDVTRTVLDWWGVVAYVVAVAVWFWTVWQAIRGAWAPDEVRNATIAYIVSSIGAFILPFIAVLVDWGASAVIPWAVAVAGGLFGLIYDSLAEGR